MGQTGEAVDDAHELVDAHVDVLDDAAVEHRHPDAASLAVGLGATKNPENDALLAGETVTRVGDVVEHGAIVASVDGHAG